MYYVSTQLLKQFTLCLREKEQMALSLMHMHCMGEWCAITDASGGASRRAAEAEDAASV